jgi:hypothetical protein
MAGRPDHAGRVARGIAISEHLGRLAIDRAARLAIVWHDLDKAGPFDRSI